MEKRTYRVTMTMAMAALAALPWVVNAQGVGVGAGSNVGVGVGAGANVNAGVAGGTTSGNITTGTNGNVATDVAGPRGVLRADPEDPNILRNEASDMDGHANERTAVGASTTTDMGVLAPAKTGTRAVRHVRGAHGTVKTNATTHGTVKVR